MSGFCIPSSPHYGQLLCNIIYLNFHAHFNPTRKFWIHYLLRRCEIFHNFACKFHGNAEWIKFTDDVDLQITFAFSETSKLLCTKKYKFFPPLELENLFRICYSWFSMGSPQWWAVFAWIYDIMLFCISFKRIQLDFSDMCIIFRSCRITRDKKFVIFPSLHPFLWIYEWINVWVGLIFMLKICFVKILNILVLNYF